MKTILIGTFDCPYCGASSVNEFEPFSQKYAIGKCATCGANFKVYREDLVEKKIYPRKTKREVVQKKNTYDRNALLFGFEDTSKQKNKEPEITQCPRCRSHNVRLYNSLKRTFHCIDCDRYFDKYGCTIRNPNIPQRTHHNYVRRPRWNGWTDPDNPAKDGLANDGW